MQCASVLAMSSRHPEQKGVFVIAMRMIKSVNMSDDTSQPTPATTQNDTVQPTASLAPEIAPADKLTPPVTSRMPTDPIEREKWIELHAHLANQLRIKKKIK